MANNADAYKVWRTANGKIILSPQNREDVCKLDAEGYSLSEMRKYITVTQDELDGYRKTPDYQARLKTLQKLAADSREMYEIPETPDQMRRYAIKNLIKLCRKATKADAVKVTASKALFECATELNNSLPVTKTAAALPSDL